MSLGAISPRSVARTLADRGVRSPPVETIQAHLQTLGDAAVADLKQLLRRVEQGVERAGEIDALLLAIKASAEIPAVAPPPAAASPRVDQAPAPFSAPAPAATDRHAPGREELLLLRQNGMHVWALKAAIKVELALLPAAGDVRDGIPAGDRYTVQFEAAKKVGAGYAWDRKVIFQLTAEEVPVVAAFVLGYAGESLELVNHGRQHDKVLGLRIQEGGLFLRVAEAGQRLAAGAPLAPAQAYRLGEILCTALKLNRPHCPAEMQLALLRRLGDMHLTRRA